MGVLYGSDREQPENLAVCDNDFTNLQERSKQRPPQDKLGRWEGKSYGLLEKLVCRAWAALPSLLEIV